MKNTNTLKRSLTPLARLTRLKPVTPFTLLMSSALLVACGGSGGGSDEDDGSSVVTTTTGQFLDSAVAGLTYVSGSRSGITDAAGTFEYQILDGVAQDVSFSFNGIELGSAPGKSVVTPVDLVEDGQLEQVTVQNIARFLQMLDSDGDPQNGIAPSAELLTALGEVELDWPPLDFTDPDFGNQLALLDVIQDLNTYDSTLHVLPSAGQASAHLQQTIACQSSGIFSGTFSGEDAGHYVLWIQHQRVDPLVFGDTYPRAGVTSAYVYSQLQNRLIGVSPQAGLRFDASNGFVAGQANNGAEFSASLEDFNRIVNGVWRNDVEGGSGAFSGTRVAGDPTARYRLSGAVGVESLPLATADNTGAIALDVFADDQVRGELVTSRGQHYPFAGTLVDGSLVLTTAEGLSLGLIFDASGDHVDHPDQVLFGEPGFWGYWQVAGVGGVLVGSSCELNGS
ncbi:MAG: hypothetical protein VYA55_04205 [Pseudomonadota bacterium]|nr:hypothetical protein [Pseudomonadota bacterium]